MDAPKPKNVYVIIQAGFTGIDLRNSAANVAGSRSPYCVNMIRDTVGTNRKRYGYETLHEFTGRINGIHELKTAELQSIVVHSGTKLYEYDSESEEWTLLYSSMADNLSNATQMNSKLYIQDGNDIVVFDGFSIKTIEEEATIPLVSISRGADGSGTSNQKVNLIQPKRSESYLGDNTHLVYQMGSTNIDSATVEMKVLNNDGTYTTLTENTDFTVNRTLGTFTLTKVRPTPVDGHDNIFITYSKTVTGYADRIKKTKFSILYGINGLRDRMFVSGNTAFPHYDWYCEGDNPGYFPDINYAVIGQDNSAIVGYSVLNGYLMTYKDGAKNNTNVSLRNAVYDNDTKAIQFQTIGSYEAEGAFGQHTFQTIQNEPMYLTSKKNIQAITPSDITGERISQERSYYISTALDNESEEDLKNAYSCAYKDFYLLSVGDKIYILDTAQYSYEENAPYATRQYECYLWTNIGARVICEINGRLYFGTSDGKLKRFHNQDVGGYTDDGILRNNTVEIDGQQVTTVESFPCYWETPELYTASSNRVNHSELKKTFKHMAIALKSAIHTGCRVWANIDGIWEVIFDYDGSASYLSFEDIDFTDFTFRTDDTPTIVGGKFKGKKLLHIQFRFENSKPQPFAVLWAKTKYTVGNEYRK